jgi:hypothetical protein
LRGQNLAKRRAEGWLEVIHGDATVGTCEAVAKRAQDPRVKRRGLLTILSNYDGCAARANRFRPPGEGISVPLNGSR